MHIHIYRTLHNKDIYNDNEVMDYDTYGNQCSHLIQFEFFETLLFS